MRRRTLLAALALAAAPGAARAQAWPAKPLRIVVPFAPGGSGDITARLLGRFIEERTGQSVVVDNRPGANGILGAMAVKQAAPDGYTLMLATTSTHAANPSLYKDPGYDPEKDFHLVGMFGSSGVFLLALPDAPFKTFAEFLAHAKANPGKLNFGHFNASSHVPAEVLADRAGLVYTAVAYKAIGNAVTDFLGGRLDFMFMDTTAARAHLVGGKMRALAVSRPERLRQYPDVPAIAETFPGFATTGFLGVAVPAGTPRATMQRLNDLVNDAIESAEIKARLDEFGMTPVRLSLDEVARIGREERIKWAEFVRIAKLEPQ